MTTVPGLHTFDRHDVGSKYHVEYPTLKHVENSLRGSKHAHRTHHKTTDLDMLPDEVLVKAASHAAAIGQPIPRSAIAGHILNEHWPEPIRRDGFKDPKGILHRDDKITEMNPDEWGRLVARSGGHRYHILPIERQLALCPTLPLQVLLEPKHSTVWLHPEVWHYLAEFCIVHHTHVAVYSLMHECLPFARRAGFNAWAI